MVSILNILSNGWERINLGLKEIKAALDWPVLIICMLLFLYIAYVIMSPRKNKYQLFYAFLTKSNVNYLTTLTLMMFAQYFLLLIMFWTTTIYGGIVYIKTSVLTFLFIGALIVIIIEFLTIVIKLSKYGIKFIRDVAKLKNISFFMILHITIVLIIFISIVPVLFSVIYTSVLTVKDLEYVNENNIDLFDYLYYTFSISYSLPENEVQNLIDRNEWIRFLFIVQVILTRFVELVLLGSIASIITKKLFGTKS